MFLKEKLCTSIQQSFLVEKLSASQLANLKLIKKKDKDKRLIKNWQPICLLNVDKKPISKALTCQLKNIISNILIEIKLSMSIIGLQVKVVD